MSQPKTFSRVLPITCIVALLVITIQLAAQEVPRNSLNKELIEGGATLDKAALHKEAITLAERYQLKDVHSLLSKGTDPDARDVNGRTALMLAARYKNRNLMNVLIQLGSNVNLQDNEGSTALLYVMRGRCMPDDGRCVDGLLETMRTLLAAGANPNVMNKKSESALGIAIPTGDDIARANLRNSVSGLTRSLEVVDGLLAAGGDPNLRMAHGLTPLMMAAGRGLGDIVKLLLAHGADVNLKAEFGLTAYQVAVGDDVIEALEKARGPRKRLPPPSGTTPELTNNLLLQAVQHGNTELAQQLIVEEGADLNYPGRFGNASPIMNNAVQSRNPRTVELILKHRGAKDNLDAALRDAIQRSQPLEKDDPTLEIVKLLVNAGASSNASDGDVTALAIAASKGTVEIVDLLLAHGADPNLKDKAGRNALLYALTNDRFALRLVDVVRALLKAGVDTNAKDNQGRSAREIAQSKGRTAIVNLLDKPPSAK